MIFFGTIVGAIIGAIISFGLYLFQCACDILSCDVVTRGYAEPVMPWKICAIIGALIGFIVGLVKQIEEWQLEKKQRREQEEEEKRQRLLAMEQSFNEWSLNLRNKYADIEKGVFDTINFKYDNNTYSFMRHKLSEANAKENSQRYINEYNKRWWEHKTLLETIVQRNIGKDMTIMNIRASLNALTCIYHMDETNSEIVKAYNRLNEFLKAALEPVTYLKFESYGSCYFELENEDRMSYLDANIDDLYNNLMFRINSLSNNASHGFEGLQNYMTPAILYEAGEIMWYYAKKMPFNVAKFQEMQEVFSRFKVSFYDSDRTDAPVEAVLAQIYAKNQMGGETTAKQDVKYIEAWLLKQIKNDTLEACYLLTSGLAWLELYNIEKDMLNKMVELSVQLPLELQERLTLLESGNMAKLVIYENSDPNIFMFDDSSLEWGMPEYNMFFHILEKKKVNLPYSLVINKWTNNTPLKPGQKFDLDELIGEFYSMINDFDGEVRMTVEQAKAVNLNNIYYERAIIFKFDSNRNRCLTMLFACEKYGRNLASTILVMFSPDERFSYNDQKNYAIAIKNNIYVESFKESIYQSIDMVLKDEIDIYSGM